MKTVASNTLWGAKEDGPVKPWIGNWLMTVNQAE